MSRYVVVTPARNEADYLGETIASMQQQTIAPERWVIVDDGSTDATGEIAERAATEEGWIEVVRRSDRGHRSAGTGVMEAFRAGLERLDGIEWDVIVKLDADLEFGADYFERCLDALADDPTLGIVGGKLYDVHPDRVVHDPHPEFHVRGATKVYRSECWHDIGGLLGVPGWDTLDEVKANQLGWSTRSLPDVPIYQLRPTGEAAGGWSNWVKNGVAAYQSGYHPAFVVARAGRRAVDPPSLSAPVGLVWGYLRAVVTRPTRVDDPELLSYVKQQQWNRLVGRETIWR